MAHRHATHGAAHERWCHTLTPHAVRPQYARRAKRLAALASGVRVGRKPLSLNLVPPLAFIHQLTQSYFLTATDAAGNPLEWHALPRLEALEAELAPILEAATKERCRGERCATAWRHKPLFPRRNAKINPMNQYRQLRSELLNRTDAMCDICQYLAQDYVCLGYHFPDACLRPACTRAPGRPPLLERALRIDCARRLWPSHCLVAFPDRLADLGDPLQVGIALMHQVGLGGTGSETAVSRHERLRKTDG